MFRDLLGDGHGSLRAFARKLLLFRLLLVVLCLLISSIGYVQDWFEIAAISASLFAAAVLTLFYSIVFHFIPDSKIRSFIFIQLLADVVLASALMWATGGIGGAFSFLVFFITLAAAVGFGIGATLFFASLCVVAMSMISILYEYRIGPDVWVASFQAMRLNDYITVHLMNSFGLFFFAGLVSVLSGQLTRFKVLHALMLERIADGVILFDADGRLQTQNDAARAIIRRLGLKDDRASLTFESVVGVPINRMMNEIGENEAEVIALPVGSTWYQIQCSKTDQISGLPVGIIATLTDITAERELLDAKLRVERLVAISELGASIAHEIRNPMATIRGAVQEISRQLPDENKPFRRLSELVVKEVGHIDRIIDDFLQLAKMRSPVKSAVALDEHLDEYRLMLGSRSDSSGIDIQFVCDGAPVIDVDPEQIRQVWLNLALNAFEALKGVANPKLTFQFIADKPSHKMKFRVFDNGIGIPSENRDKIFSPFFTTRSNGVGLGLSIVRRILQMNGGSIDIGEPDGGVGACFTGALPLRQEGVEIVRRVSTRKINRAHLFGTDVASGAGDATGSDRARRPSVE